MFLLEKTTHVNEISSPVVGGDVPLQVKLTVMELNHGETSTANHVDLVHTGNAALEDCCHEIQDLRRTGSG